MSFLYRCALTVTRKQPYLDWVNSFDDDGPRLTEELASERRAIYLVSESPQEPELPEDRFALGVMTDADSDDARDGLDLLFRTCSSECERALPSAVPKALRRGRR